MLVAEKQQYLESYYPRRRETIPTVEQPKIVPKAKARPKSKVMPIIMILIGFAICSFTVARYAMIAQNQSEILNLEKMLEQEYKKEERLALELTYRGDLKQIEEFAKNNLEMDYPDKDQVLFVELPKQNQNTSEKTEMAQQDEETLWNRIISLLD